MSEAPALPWRVPATAPERPAVSVIVPTYQRRELVKRAVASVLAQTHRDFELIVIDDGSTDGTAEALAPLGARVRYEWQENRGVSAARNAALRLARGEIVAFLDSDDRWLPEHLAVVTQVLSRFPEASVVSTCPDLIIAGRRRAARLFDPMPRALVGSQVGYPSCVAVRREALAATGGFNEALPVLEDTDLFLRLAMRGPFGSVRRRTVVHQNTPGSLREQGQRSGEYMEAFEATARETLVDLEETPAATAPGLRARAVGRLQYALALRALAEGDARAARAALEDACRLMPELHRESLLVWTHLRLLPYAHVPEKRLRDVAGAARLWPDSRADTALFLRAGAMLLALRYRRPRAAAALLSRWPVSSTPGFLWRSAPAVLAVAFRSAYASFHRPRARGAGGWGC